MIPKYKYNKAENKIVQVASIEHPNKMFYMASDEDFWNKDVSDYEEHIASLKTFPCHSSCIDIWEDGKEVEQDKDFELLPCCDFMCDGTCVMHHSTLIATPTPPVVNEDEVWREATNILIGEAAVIPKRIDEIISILKQHYTITKK